MSHSKVRKWIMGAVLVVLSNALVASGKNDCPPPFSAGVEAVAEKAREGNKQQVVDLQISLSNVAKELVEVKTVTTERLNGTERGIAVQGEALKQVTNRLGILETNGKDVSLQDAAWLAALIAASIAALGFRKTVYQSRATTLLAIQKQSDELGEAAKTVATLRNKALAIKNEAIKGGKADEDSLVEARNWCANEITSAQNDPSRLTEYLHFMKYLSFFEKVGLMVRHRYIPLADVVELYKGPIMEIRELFGTHISTLQQDKTIKKGIFENAMLLVGKTESHESASQCSKLWQRIKDWF